MEEITIDNYLNYIYNEVNKPVPVEFINNIFKRFNIEHKVNNLTIFQEALTHPTYQEKYVVKEAQKIIKILCGKDKNYEKCIKKHVMKLLPRSYERLEYLGDSVIHLIIADYLYERFYEEDEGFMTRLRIKIENGHMLSIFSRIIGLNEYVVIARYIEQDNSREIGTHLLEDILESFIGALFVDSNNNFDLCKQLMIQLIENEIDFAWLLNNENNYKDILLRHFHKIRQQPPEYSMLEQLGDDKKIFKMCVKTHDGNIIGIGSGTTKKNGEQMAAKQALLRYNLINNEEDEDEVYKVDE